jgi:hypothetical protein
VAAAVETQPALPERVALLLHGVTELRAAAMALVAAAAARPWGQAVTEGAAGRLRPGTMPRATALAAVAAGRISQAAIARRASAGFGTESMLRAVAPATFAQATSAAVYNVYMSPSGSDSNNGLTVSTPVQTFAAAFAIFAACPSFLNGAWRLNLAAGTYTPYAAPQTIKTAGALWIRGPDVSDGTTPTTIIDGSLTSGDYAHGLVFDDMYVLAEDLKFIGFNGDPTGNTRCGLVAQNRARLATRNVHANDCSWAGIYADFHCVLRVQSGIIDACRLGVAANDSNCTVGYGATSLAEGVTIKNCTQEGVQFAKGAQGHVDYTTLDSNAIGIRSTMWSRAHVLGCDIKKNTIGIQADNGGTFQDDTNTWNDGGASANTENVRRLAFGGEFTELSSAYTETRVKNQQISTTHTGTTALTVLNSSFHTLAANRLTVSTKQRLRVRQTGVFTSVSAGTLISLRVGTATHLQLTVSAAPASSAAFVAEWDFNPTAAAGQRWTGKLIVDGIAPTVRWNTSTVDMTSSQALSMAAQLGDAADSMILREVDVYLTD